MGTTDRQLQERKAASLTPFAIWEASGITEHMGGVPATRRLLERCQVAPGQRMLDLGCGTGYTATLLAERYRARVLALDLNQELVAATRRRATRAVVGHRVDVLQADAHAVPLAAGRCDVVLVESVLVFCAPQLVLAEIQRVLRSGGSVGINELTLRRPPSEALRIFLRDTLHIQTYDERAWRALLHRAGFARITAVVEPLPIGEQLLSHEIIEHIFLGLMVVSGAVMLRERPTAA